MQAGLSWGVFSSLGPWVTRLDAFSWQLESSETPSVTRLAPNSPLHGLPLLMCLTS